MSAICLLSSVAVAQETDRKVTFAQPPMRAEALLALLSKETGLSFGATSKTANDVLTIRVKDVPLSALMAKVAEVDGAEWIREGNGYRLTRSAALAAKQAREEASEEAARIDQSLRRAKERVAKLPPFSIADATRLAEEQQKRLEEVRNRGGGAFRISNPSSENGERMPAARAIVQLLSELGGASLVTIEPNGRGVWSTQPNSVQGSLGGHSMEILRRFIADQKMLSDEIQRRQPDDGRQIQFFGASGGNMGPGDPSLGIGKALLLVTRTGNVYRAQLIVADPNGKTIANGVHTLLMSPTGSGATGTSKIEMSQVVQEFGRLIGASSSRSQVRTGGMMIATIGNGKTITMGGGAPAAKLVEVSPALKARLLNPEQNDPQGLAVAEALTAAAGNRNLVACFPDSGILPLTRRMSSGDDAEGLLKNGFAQVGANAEIADGWLLVRPKAPVSARRNAIDRRALGRLVRSIDSKKSARLDDLASFAESVQRPITTNDYEAEALRLVHAPSAATAQTMLETPDILRFYGSLNPAQRSSLETGQPVSLATLTNAQLSLIAHETFQSNRGPEGTGGIRGVAMLATSLEVERTEMLPSGIVRNGSVTLNLNRDAGVVAYDASGGSTLMTPASLASQMFQAEKPEMAFMGPVQKPERFQVAQQTTLTFTFQLSPTARLVRSLQDAAYDANAPKVPFDGLPAEIKTSVQSSLDELRNALSNVKINSPQRQTPPPL